MKDNLLILGAGQYGRVTKEIAEVTGRFEKIDFLDDNNPNAIGKMADYAKYADQYSHAIVAIGNPQLRLQLMDIVRGCFRIPTLIHPQGYVSPSAVLGEGCVVEPMAVVHTETVIGRACLICAGAVVNHDATVGDGCQVDCNSTVAARAEVPRCTKVCSGEVFCQQK